MRPFAMGMMLVFAAAPMAVAASPKVPYQAIVEADQVYVRSGPGEKYYATGTLKKGDRVTVQRIDPGQWFMIVPPRGSFSWIPAKYVQKVATNRGQVTANNVVVRVGSTESDIREVEQRRLSKGDEVSIIGEKKLSSEGASAELWYRIEPPRNEWRWMLGRYLTPIASTGIASTGIASAGPEDPNADPFDERLAGARPAFSNPALPKESGAGIAAKPGKSVPRPVDSYDQSIANGPAESGGSGSLVERPMVRRENRPKDQGGVNQTGPLKSKLESERAELRRLDEKYQAVLDREMASWDFDEVERGYLKLRGEVSHINFQNVIDERLASIVKNRQAKVDEDELARLRRETETRDADLAAQQQKLDAQLASRSKPRPDGAGIVQRSANRVSGAPQYVLLAPNGRVLAYLQPGAGVDLEQYIGRAAGIYGQRSYRQELSTDLIIVSELKPVRLAP